MAYDFKKINELELVNGVPEGANVLIETEGTTKRLPSTAINNGYSKEEVYNKNEAYSKDEVYNKNEADEKFLTKETIAKPDWNQNDENAPDYVKNRTHWSVVSAVIEEQAIEGFAVMQDPIYVVQNPFIFSPIAGDRYIVHWDGIAYVVEAQNLDGCICLGNENYWAMNTGGGIPFAILVLENDIMFIATESTANSHTICIESEVVHKLNPKYLPKGYPYEETDVVNEPLNITWDGNTEGLVNVGDYCWKVSDLILTDEQIKSAIITTDEFSFSIADKWDEMNVEDDIVSTPGNEVIFVRKDGVYDFSKAGIYFRQSILGLTTTEPVEQTKTVVKKLDKKFLPDDIGGGSIMYCGGNNDDDDVHLFHFDFDTGEIGAAVTRGELVAAIKHGAIYIALIDEYSVNYKLATFVHFGDDDGYIGTSDEEYFHTAEFEQSSGPV